MHHLIKVSKKYRIFADLLLLYSEVSDYVVPFSENVLLVMLLIRSDMVNHIRNAVFVALIGNNTDMVFEHNNISALPLVRFVYVGRKAFRSIPI